MSAPAPVIHLLFVCTANRCRSPMAEALARSELTRRAIPFSVRSAGFLPGGFPAEPRAVSVMAERGLDLSAHRSVELDRSVVAGADLVVTMEGAHTLEIVRTWADLADRTTTFTAVVEAAGDVLAGRRPAPGHPADLVGEPDDDRRGLDRLLDQDRDVADPIGGPARAFRRTADLLGAGLETLTEVLAGAVSPPSR